MIFTKQSLVVNQSLLFQTYASGKFTCSESLVTVRVTALQMCPKVFFVHFGHSFHISRCNTIKLLAYYIVSLTLYREVLLGSIVKFI